MNGQWSSEGRREVISKPAALVRAVPRMNNDAPLAYLVIDTRI